MGAGFRCGYWAALTWQLEHHHYFRLRRLELFVRDRSDERKIGQCAVGVGRRVRVFGDRLMLEPSAQALWPAAMTAIVEQLGDGTYVYGSEWSLEPPRERDLARMAGVRVLDVAPTRVLTIDFTRWPNEQALVAAFSANVRRNVKKAERLHPALRLEWKGSLGGVARFVRGVLMRRSLFTRKGVERSTLAMALRSLVRLGSLRRYSDSVYAYNEDALLATYGGVNFGYTFAYLEGASEPTAHGAQWFLLVAVIRRAFATSGGRGRFVMGSDDGTKSGDAWDGLRRSRAQVAAEPWPTSVVRFAFEARRSTAASPTPSVVSVERADPVLAASENA